VVGVHRDALQVHPVIGWSSQHELHAVTVFLGCRPAPATDVEPPAAWMLRVHAENAEILDPLVSRAFHARQLVDDLAGKLGSKMVEQRDSRGDKIRHQNMMHALRLARKPPREHWSSRIPNGFATSVERHACSAEASSTAARYSNRVDEQRRS